MLALVYLIRRTAYRAALSSCFLGKTAASVVDMPPDVNKTGTEALFPGAFAGCIPGIESTIVSL
jgi:hypothetical protein